MANATQSGTQAATKTLRVRKDRYGWTVHIPEIRTKIVQVVTASLHGVTREREVALRIDGRGGVFRVDVRPSSLEPWEATTGPETFPSLAAAREHVASWLAAVAEQKTTTPRMPRG